MTLLGEAITQKKERPQIVSHEGLLGAPGCKPEPARKVAKDICHRGKVVASKDSAWWVSLIPVHLTGALDTVWHILGGKTITYNNHSIMKMVHVSLKWLLSMFTFLSPHFDLAIFISRTFILRKVWSVYVGRGLFLKMFIAPLFNNRFRIRITLMSEIGKW